MISARYWNHPSSTTDLCEGELFCHLFTHSYFSLLEALPSPAELVQAAQAQGMTALALTDHNSLGGSVEFYLACQKAGIKPILGLEIDLEAGIESHRLVLLAASLDGWSKLCQLTSAILLRESPDEPVSFELLSSLSGDLLALAGSNLNEVGLRRLADLFSERLCLRLDTSGNYRARLDQAELASRLGVPLVAAPPVYYLSTDQAALQRTLAAIRLISPLNKLPPEAAAPLAASFLTSAEMRQAYHDFPAALSATNDIAARCQVTLPLGKPRFPKIPLPPGKTAAQVLRQKAMAGARRIYKQITPEIQARLDYELKVISERGFEPIFLIVEEVLAYARENSVPFSSRGSAASSLVAHCLGITSPDPLALDLFFERFLNPARATPPDIDTDLCSRGRDAVIQHVFATYGEEQVAMVGTINRFRPRSALGDVAKAHGLSPEIIRTLVNTLPYGFFSRRSAEVEEEDGKVPPSPFAELTSKNRQPLYQQIFHEAEALLKLPRHFSVHAGGLIVGPCPLAQIVPLQRSGSKGITITQMDLESAEALGLIKIDLLGIRGLTVMGDVASAIYSWRRSEFKKPIQVLESIPTDDEETSDRLEHGQTVGCFQIESPGMQATLKEIRARTLDDLMVALALYRPGPLTGGLKDSFVRRFKGEEPVSHLHPALEPLLENTFGVILYQEQVLRIAHSLAGFSLAEADLLRRAMSHFDPGKQMQLLKEKFIARSLEISGVPAETANRIWELMAAFAGYGFPKAHAASYAQVAWRSAWCKTHFPAEFMAAVLANWGGYYSQQVYLAEARRMHLTIRPPHVNQARREFSVNYPQGEPILYMGLDQVRDLSGRTQERILSCQPFRSLDDFLERVDPRLQEAENLARVGALEGFGTIPAILQRLQTDNWRAGQMNLFGWNPPAGEDWSLVQRVTAQQEILGTSLDAHPLELYPTQIAAAGAITTVEAAGKKGGKVCVAGVRQSGHRSWTGRGDPMMFITLEDLEGTLDVVLFPDTYRRYRQVLSTSGPFFVTGRIELDPAREEPLLRAEKIELIH